MSRPVGIALIGMGWWGKKMLNVLGAAPADIRVVRAVEPNLETARALCDEKGVALTGDDGLLTSMVREVLQAGLDVEMAEHLGYEPYESVGRGSGNSRNGSYPKTVTTDVGPVELQMPRDRQGTFDPVTVPKHVRRLEGLGASVLSLYAKGLTTGEIQAHLAGLENDPHAAPAEFAHDLELPEPPPHQVCTGKGRSGSDR